jgi:hypothetical protein
MSGAPFGGRQPLEVDHSITLRLSGFAWRAIEQESARQGVPVEEMLAFAAMYYLADVDSGRIAREVSLSPYGADPLTPEDAVPDTDAPEPPSAGADPSSPDAST